jgi:hypothetical protein
MRGLEMVYRAYERFGLSHLGLQQRLDLQQTCSVRKLLQQLLDVFEARQSLSAFQHPLDAVEFVQEIVAAKLYLFARSARAGRVAINGHRVLEGSRQAAAEADGRRRATSGGQGGTLFGNQRQ